MLLIRASIAVNAQKKWDYIVFFKPYTTERETNLYTSGPIKFDFNTQYTNIKDTNLNADFDRAVRHKDYRAIAISGVEYLLPGITGANRDKYFKKEYFKVIEGTSDAINSSAPPLQSVAYDYAIHYNKLLLKYLKDNKMP